MCDHVVLYCKCIAETRQMTVKKVTIQTKMTAKIVIALKKAKNPFLLKFRHLEMKKNKTILQ